MYIIYFILFVLAMGAGAMGFNSMYIMMWFGIIVVGSLVGKAFYNDVTGKTAEVVEQQYLREQEERNSRRPNRDILE